MKTLFSLFFTVGLTGGQAVASNEQDKSNDLNNRVSSHHSSVIIRNNEAFCPPH